MVRYSSNSLRMPIEPAYGSAKLLVEFRAPFPAQVRFPVFGGEYEVVMEACVGGWHRCWHPLTGCIVFFGVVRWYRSYLAKPPATILEASGFPDTLCSRRPHMGNRDLKLNCYG